MILSLILLSTFLISLGGLIGVFTLAINHKVLQRVLMSLVALSTGALMGGAFLHLLPEAIELMESEKVFTAALFSFAGFFLIEKLLHWRHCHKDHCSAHTFGYMNLIGDGLHNFLDGLIIAAAFLTDISLGWATTMAIALHEIPQEIGDFGVLLYSGWNKKKALLVNFGTALTAVLGGLVGYYLSWLGNLSGYLMAVASGGFIYIAASDLLPEMRKETGWKKIFSSLVFFLMGITLMAVFKD